MFRFIARPTVRVRSDPLALRDLGVRLKVILCIAFANVHGVPLLQLRLIIRLPLCLTLTFVQSAKATGMACGTLLLLIPALPTNRSIPLLSLGLGPLDLKSTPMCILLAGSPLSVSRPHALMFSSEQARRRTLLVLI